MKVRSAFQVLLLAALAGCGGGDGEIELDVAVPVSVVELKPGAIEEYVTATGTARALKEASIQSEVGGYYRLLENPATGEEYSLDDRVERGAGIIRIINEEEENTIAVESKELALETARLDYEQQKSLYEKGGVTRTEFKQSEEAYINARYAYENARIRLGKFHITAPFDGVITSLPYYTPGIRIDAGVDMVTIQEYSGMMMEISLPGKDLGRVRPGQRARIMNYSIPDDTLSGTVREVSPALDPDTRSFGAAIRIANDGYLLRPGMFVKAEIIVSSSDSALVIPKDVIQSKPAGKTVFVVNRGAANERIIQTGLENPDYVEVTSGLEEGERLVVRGFETLRNRSRVKVIE